MAKLKVILLLIIALVIVYPNDGIEASFTDVSPNSWYASHVQRLTEKNLIKGNVDGTFKPNDTIIRQNVARILGRWLIEENYYIPEDALTNKRFNDIPLTSDEELLQVTALLYEEGVFAGAAGHLDGKNAMTREQMALVLVRTLKSLYDIDLIALANQANYQSTITDIHNLTSGSQQAIVALSYVGLTKNTQYLPKDFVTRAEFSTFLDRTMQYVEAKTPEEQSNNDAEQIIVPSNTTHIELKKGTTLYASSNFKREIALLEADERFPYNYLPASNALFIEIGAERYYIKLSEASFIALENEMNQQASSIGYLRLSAPFMLYVDEALTIPIVKGLTESKFSIQSLSGYVAKIEAQGNIYYADYRKHTIHPNIPHELLQATAITNQAGTKTIGLLQAGNIILPKQAANGKTIIQDQSGIYSIPATTIVEVDVGSSSPAQLKQHSIPVTFKQDQQLYANGKIVGTIKAGEKLVVSSTDGNNGYSQFASVLVQFPLANVYHTNIIDGSKMITYETMVQSLKSIHTLYPSFTKLEIIGKTVEGKDIYALKVGTGKREILMDASLHAREYMTTNVLMEMIDEYTNAYTRNTTFDGYNVKSILDKTSIWFVPMINVDGVTLVQKGVNSTAYKDTVLKLNGSSNVGRWKANIRGVDLNRNFDNNWAKAATEPAPAWHNFKGYSAFSEPESRALRDFVAKHNFQAYVSYHSSGNVLYYWNWQSAANQQRDFNFAKAISNKTGYSIMKPQFRPASGSSADWFIRVYKRPGITMEISSHVGNQPVPFKNWADIWKRNKGIGLLSAKESEKF